MQITLDIDPAQLSLGVLEILRGLSQEKKEEIAASVIKDWLSETPKDERRIFENELVRNMMKRKNESEEKVRESYDFREAARKFVPVREKMVKTIIEEAVKTFQAIVKQQIDNDEYLRKTFDEVLAKVELNFPDYVRDAIIHWFGQNMQQIMFNLQNTEVNNMNLTGQVENILQHLRSNGAAL